MAFNQLTGILVYNLFLIGAHRRATSHLKRLKREAFPLKVCNDFCHFVNVRHEFFLNKVTSYWNEFTNSHVNALNINSLKTGLDSLPIMAAKAYQAH